MSLQFGIIDYIIVVFYAVLATTLLLVYCFTLTKLIDFSSVSVA